MRAIVSRVLRASVSVDGQVVGSIDRGLLVYVGILQGDAEADLQWMADKLVNLRVFDDEQGKLNKSVLDVSGGLLLISNFTLAGRTNKGTRPSYTDAAPPEIASPMFDRLVSTCSQRVPTSAGQFRAHMQIDSLADGPVTIILESPGSRTLSPLGRVEDPPWWGLE